MTKAMFNSQASIPAMTGKSAAAREEAYKRIAPAAYVEGTSRADVIAALQSALGKRPTATQLACAQTEYQAGRIAARLDKATGMGATTDAQRIAVARNLLTASAMPLKAGAKRTKLASGKIHRRSDAQHKLVRAANEYWSKLLVDAGLRDGVTSKAKRKADTAKEKAKRSTNSNPVRGDGKGDAPTSAKPDVASMPKATMTAAIANAHIAQQSATLLAFCNKHADHVDGPIATAVIAAQKAIAAHMATRESIRNG